MFCQLCYFIIKSIFLLLITFQNYMKEKQTIYVIQSDNQAYIMKTIISIIFFIKFSGLTTEIIVSINIMIKKSFNDPFLTKPISCIIMQMFMIYIIKALYIFLLDFFSIISILWKSSNIFLLTKLYI